MAGMRLMAGACYVAAMSKTPERMIAGLTTGERNYIRRELDIFFSTLPSVAEGFRKTSTHLALDDVRDSIRELQYYRERLLRTF